MVRADIPLARRYGFGMHVADIPLHWWPGYLKAPPPPRSNPTSLMHTNKPTGLLRPNRGRLPPIPAHQNFDAHFLHAPDPEPYLPPNLHCHDRVYRHISNRGHDAQPLRLLANQRRLESQSGGPRKLSQHPRVLLLLLFDERCYRCHSSGSADPDPAAPADEPEVQVRPGGHVRDGNIVSIVC